MKQKKKYRRIWSQMERLVYPKEWSYPKIIENFSYLKILKYFLGVYSNFFKGGDVVRRADHHYFIKMANVATCRELQKEKRSKRFNTGSKHSRKRKII